MDRNEKHPTFNHCEIDPCKAFVTKFSTCCFIFNSSFQLLRFCYSVWPLDANKYILTVKFAYFTNNLVHVLIQLTLYNKFHYSFQYRCKFCWEICRTKVIANYPNLLNLKIIFQGYHNYLLFKRDPLKGGF